MAEKSSEQIRSEFDDVVNMSAKELEDWLGTDESQSVGQSSGDDDESTGHFMGRRIVEIQKKDEGELDDDDLAAMKKVHGYVARHTKQKPSKEDIETSKWRYSLMNWGHDPLK
ncbi:DUF3140 domain-containing protein [Actinomycetospora straminea]|uniref:DUF3140 domain-containing protein n=1 Tax=Actinomycetospora straminea TaxID=663607 RepID=A0ABP9EV91_9PSEU|nr:DUF3140 domain-containing protein [Actinomycetospora straminea]MDD7932995.1 DUF3140 domain-containing protein [Actinomycetospora straminea]